MQDMRVGTILHLLSLSFCAYYIYCIAASNARYLYELSPNLWNIRCGQTSLSWLTNLPFIDPYSFRQTACCVGSHCVSVAHKPTGDAELHVPRSLNQYLRYWCDNEYHGWFNSGSPAVCHLTFAGGIWQVDISRAFIPTIRGVALVVLFSYALRHAMTRRSSVTTVILQPQVQEPANLVRVNESKVSEEAAQDLKRLSYSTKNNQQTPDEKMAVPVSDAELNDLDAYMERLPHIDAGSVVVRRVGPRPRKV